MEQSPFQRPKRHLLAEMNVVPYIDVMLVLLVIFMITAPMLTQGVKVELPKVASETIQVNSEEPVVVSIKADGSYWLKQGKDDNQSMALDELTSHLLTAQQQQPNLQVLINGDTQVPYGEVVKLMAALQKAQIIRVGLLTEPPQDQ
ncbi:MAG TPA: protein TolR [Agitococcus sp.]|uniref:protein TolR n=1 Tax=uncultured Agitococcus sp. TaxID=1506599 RepID=UPI00260EBB50|nr:protein TolR [uncultured Agitococcus sp.]HMU87571.1 protein TolR [Agitococcus sp.]HMY00347.1 protein TolR [Agitococcus sp.]HMY82715.1 protein TolR [Agitococcus sp.]HNB20357.1 protein TolR [Agitococcus sp.]HNC03423.1 protein TolR [Agitococcus sp.]